MIANVVTRGFGFGGTIALVVTRGYAIGAPLVVAARTKTFDVRFSLRLKFDVKYSTDLTFDVYHTLGVVEV